MTRVGPIRSAGGRLRPALAAVLTLAALLAVQAGDPTAALACSAGEDFDPLEGLDVIVAGRVTDASLTGKFEFGNFIIVDIDLAVDRYLLGSGPAVTTVTDLRSASPPAGLVRSDSDFRSLDLATVSIDEVRWDGASGSCGALDRDPRGQYWVVGARRADDGGLEIHRFSLFAIGSGPDDPAVVERQAWVEERLALSGVAPGASGDAGLASQRSGSTGGQLALLLLALVASGFARRWVRSEVEE